MSQDMKMEICSPSIQAADLRSPVVQDADLGPSAARIADSDLSSAQKADSLSKSSVPSDDVTMNRLRLGPKKKFLIEYREDRQSENIATRGKEDEEATERGSGGLPSVVESSARRDGGQQSPSRAITELVHEREGKDTTKTSISTRDMNIIMDTLIERQFENVKARTSHRSSTENGWFRPASTTVADQLVHDAMNRGSKMVAPISTTLSTTGFVEPLRTSSIETYRNDVEAALISATPPNGVNCGRPQPSEAHMPPPPLALLTGISYHQSGQYYEVPSGYSTQSDSTTSTSPRYHRMDLVPNSSHTDGTFPSQFLVSQQNGIVQMYRQQLAGSNLVQLQQRSSGVHRPDPNIQYTSSHSVSSNDSNVFGRENFNAESRNMISPVGYHGDQADILTAQHHTNQDHRRSEREYFIIPERGSRVDGVRFRTTEHSNAISMSGAQEYGASKMKYNDDAGRRPLSLGQGQSLKRHFVVPRTGDYSNWPTRPVFQSSHPPSPRFFRPSPGQQAAVGVPIVSVAGSRERNSPSESLVIPYGSLPASRAEKMPDPSSTVVVVGDTRIFQNRRKETMAAYGVCEDGRSLISPVEPNVQPKLTGSLEAEPRWLPVSRVTDLERGNPITPRRYGDHLEGYENIVVMEGPTIKRHSTTEDYEYEIIEQPRNPQRLKSEEYRVTAAQPPWSLSRDSPADNDTISAPRSTAFTVSGTFLHIAGESNHPKDEAVLDLTVKRHSERPAPSMRQPWSPELYHPYGGHRNNSQESRQGANSQRRHQGPVHSPRAQDRKTAEGGYATQPANHRQPMSATNAIGQSENTASRPSVVQWSTENSPHHNERQYPENMLMRYPEIVSYDLNSVTKMQGSRPRNESADFAVRHEVVSGTLQPQFATVEQLIKPHVGWSANQRTPMGIYASDIPQHSALTLHNQQLAQRPSETFQQLSRLQATKPLANEYLLIPTSAAMISEPSHHPTASHDLVLGSIANMTSEESGTLDLECRQCAARFSSLPSFRLHFVKAHSNEPTTDDLFIHKTVQRTSQFANDRTETCSRPVAVPVVGLRPTEHSQPSPKQSDYAPPGIKIAAFTDSSRRPTNFLSSPLILSSSPNSRNSSPSGESLLKDHMGTKDVCVQFSPPTTSSSTTAAATNLKRIGSFSAGQLRLRSSMDTHCQTCIEGFRDVSDWREHMLHSRTHVSSSSMHMMRSCSCKTCNIGFTHAEALHKHLLKEHAGVKMASVDVEYHCLFCPRKFTDAELLYEHTDNHERDYEQCMRRGSTDSSLERLDSIETSVADTTCPDEHKSVSGSRTLHPEHKNELEKSGQSLKRSSAPPGSLKAYSPIFERQIQKEQNSSRCISSSPSKEWSAINRATISNTEKKSVRDQYFRSDLERDNCGQIFLKLNFSNDSTRKGQERELLQESSPNISRTSGEASKTATAEKTGDRCGADVARRQSESPQRKDSVRFFIESLVAAEVKRSFQANRTLSASERYLRDSSGSSGGTREGGGGAPEGAGGGAGGGGKGRVAAGERSGISGGSGGKMDGGKGETGEASKGGGEKEEDREGTPGSKEQMSKTVMSSHSDSERPPVVATSRLLSFPTNSTSLENCEMRPPIWIPRDVKKQSQFSSTSSNNCMSTAVQRDEITQDVNDNRVTVEFRSAVTSLELQHSKESCLADCESSETVNATAAKLTDLKDPMLGIIENISLKNENISTHEVSASIAQLCSQGVVASSHSRTLIPQHQVYGATKAVVEVSCASSTSVHTAKFAPTGSNAGRVAKPLLDENRFTQNDGDDCSSTGRSGCDQTAFVGEQQRKRKFVIEETSESPPLKQVYCVQENLLTPQAVI